MATPLQQAKKEAFEFIIAKFNKVDDFQNFFS